MSEKIMLDIRHYSKSYGKGNKAAVVTVPRLEQVKEAGRQYAASGMIEEALLAEIGSPMIPERQYAAIVNAGAQ